MTVAHSMAANQWPRTVCPTCLGCKPLPVASYTICVTGVLMVQGKCDMKVCSLPTPEGVCATVLTIIVEVLTVASAGCLCCRFSRQYKGCACSNKAYGYIGPEDNFVLE